MNVCAHVCNVHLLFFVKRKFAQGLTAIQGQVSQSPIQRSWHYTLDPVSSTELSIQTSLVSSQPLILRAKTIGTQILKNILSILPLHKIPVQNIKNITKKPHHIEDFLKTQEQQQDKVLTYNTVASSKYSVLQYCWEAGHTTLMKKSNSLAYLNEVGTQLEVVEVRITKSRGSHLMCKSPLIPLPNSKKAIYLGKNIMRLQTIFFHKRTFKMEKQIIRDKCIQSKKSLTEPRIWPNYTSFPFNARK